MFRRKSPKANSQASKCQLCGQSLNVASPEPEGELPPTATNGDHFVLPPGFTRNSQGITYCAHGMSGLCGAGCFTSPGVPRREFQ